MEKCYRILVMIFLAVFAGSCVYDYEPDDDIQGLDKPLVVIDGDIVVGGITSVKVGLTQSLLQDEEQEVLPLGATVWVESETGEMLWGSMLEDEVNEFVVNTADLSLQGKYRLGVSVPGRGEYLSKFKSVLVAPPVDSITYSIAKDRSYARIEVTTHNDAAYTKGNDTGGFLYCKWIYTENWETKAMYPAQLEYDVKSGVMSKLSQAEISERAYCYSQAESVGTYIANTEKLSQNVIYKSVVKEIPNVDSRLMSLYSINVTQTVLDREAYIYWENIKRNSSGTGGLFSPQPSEVRGNIESTTSEGEIVIGYVNVSTVTQKRIFVDWENEKIFTTECKDELVPRAIQPPNPEADPIPQWPKYYTQGYRPIRYLDGKIDEAYWAMEECTDCRKFSNSTRPDFWPTE